jgi:2-hydroxy-3-keto-5-methylthiopentenyl-1-phosphate phosphatase
VDVASKLRRLEVKRKLVKLLYSEKVAYITVEEFEGLRKEMSKELESLR